MPVIRQTITYGCRTELWDVTVEGQPITIYAEPRKIALRLVLDPPNHVIVERLNMYVGEGHLELSEDMLRVGRRRPDQEIYLGFKRIECDGADIGVQVNNVGDDVPQLKRFSIAGGEAISLDGTGVKAAVGASRMVIKGLQIEHATKEETLILEYELETNLEGTIRRLAPRIR